MLTSAKPDLDAYNSAMTMSTAELVTALRDLLGAKLVAYLGRVKETRAVRQWAEGTRTIANPTDADRPAELQEKADAALHRAKAEGRNRVDTADTTATTGPTT